MTQTTSPLPTSRLFGETSMDLPSWLGARSECCDMQISEIAWRMSKEWVFDQGRLRHRTGGFFSVVGATLSRQGRRIHALDQPLIDQPEIGILGFIVADGAEGKEILVQGKPEPGNVHLVQAAPTVQATESNYKRRHRGRSTPFLECFLHGSGAQILSDSLQSEQGTRFLGKYNRNMVVKVPERARGQQDNDTLRWFPVSSLLALLTEDYLINTDARSVLTTVPWRFLAANGEPFSCWGRQDAFGEALWRSYTASESLALLPQAEILSRLEICRNSLPFRTQTIGLSDLSSWTLSDSSISNAGTYSLSIRQYDVSTTEREVEHWDQPLVTSAHEGLSALFCQEKNGVLHFLFNCRAEIGFREGFQYGPTVQDLGDEAFVFTELREQENLLKGHLGRAQTQISCLHSDEGGRFHRCISKYVICMLDPDDRVEAGQNLAWMTLGQIEALVKRQGVFSNEARSLISMLLAYL